MAIAVTAIITGGITMSIFQVFDGNTRSSNHMIAVRQVQNAGYWVSRDVQMARSVAPTADPDGFPVTLTWADWDTGDEYQVVYSVSVVDNKLQREHYTNRHVNPDPDATSVAAEYIDPDNTNCEFTAGGAFSLPDANDAFTITSGAVADNGTITVTVGSISVTAADGATINGILNGSETITALDSVSWTTPAGAGTVVVVATAASTTGNWTSTTATATAAITTGDGTVAAGGVIVFRLRVTATVGTGSQEASETRVYEITPRSSV